MFLLSLGEVVIIVLATAFSTALICAMEKEKKE